MADTQNSSVQQLNICKQKLEWAFKNHNEDQVNQCLRDLQSMPIKLSDLRQTMVGVLLQDIRTQYPEADKVRKQWKTMFKKTTAGPAAPNSKPGSSKIQKKLTDKQKARKVKHAITKERVKLRPGFDVHGQFLVPQMLLPDEADSDVSRLKKSICVHLLKKPSQTLKDLYRNLQLDQDARVRSKADVSNLLHVMLTKKQIEKNKQSPPEYRMGTIWSMRKLRVKIDGPSRRLVDPNEPVKPKNGYLLFADSVRADVLENLGNDRFTMNQPKNKLVSLKIKELWENLTEAGRKDWIAQSEPSFDQYKKDMRAYKASQQYKDWIQHLRRTNPQEALQSLSRKQRVDKNAPRKPLSAYFQFMSNRRADFIAQGKGAETKNVAKFGKDCALAWQDAPPAHKTKLREDYDVAIVEYEKNMEEYRRSDDFKIYQENLLKTLDDKLLKFDVNRTTQKKDPTAPKVKIPKDPNAPKPALIPFFAFGAHYRQKVWDNEKAKAIAAGMDPNNLPKTGIGQMSQKIGAAWKLMTLAQRMPFIVVSKQDFERYHREMAEYKETEQYREWTEFLEDGKKIGDYRTVEQKARDRANEQAKAEKAEAQAKRKLALEANQERKKMKTLEVADKKAMTVIKKQGVAGLEEKPAESVCNKIKECILELINESFLPRPSLIIERLEQQWMLPAGELENVRNLIRAAIQVVSDDPDFSRIMSAEATGKSLVDSVPTMEEQEAEMEYAMSAEPASDEQEQERSYDEIDFDLDDLDLDEDQFLALTDDNQ